MNKRDKHIQEIKNICNYIISRNLDIPKNATEDDLGILYHKYLHDCPNDFIIDIENCPNSDISHRAFSVSNLLRVEDAEFILNNIDYITVILSHDEDEQV